MSCLVQPAKRVWRGIRTRLGLRRTTGLGRLRKEVRTCEYRDVHVMWEMLSKQPTSGRGSGVRNHRRRPNTAGNGTAASTRRPRPRAGRKATAAAAWSRLASYSYCCAL